VRGERTEWRFTPRGASTSDIVVAVVQGQYLVEELARGECAKLKRRSIHSPCQRFVECEKESTSRNDRGRKDVLIFLSCDVEILVIPLVNRKNGYDRRA
jgi:hypothetical protein